MHGRRGERGGAVLSMRDDCCRCLYRCLSLAERLEQMLHAKGFSRRGVEQEMALGPVLARMELTGFCVTPAPLVRDRRDMRTKLHALEGDGHALIGRSFDWASAKDVGRVLFDELRLGEADVKRLRRKRPAAKGGGKNPHSLPTAGHRW